MSNQAAIDQMMLALDGTENKCKSLICIFGHRLMLFLQFVRPIVE